MNKLNIMILSIVLSVISIVYAILSYCGCIRYILIHKNSCEKYIKRYKNLPLSQENKRVVLSFTTTPGKIGNIKPIINSILDQTVSVNQIALNIPKTITYNIPDYFTKFANIYRSGKNYGVGNKIIPTLLREGERDTIIIYVNDTHILGKDFIENMIDYHETFPNKVIVSKCGVLVTPGFFDETVVDNDKKMYSDEWILNHFIVDIKKVEYNESFKFM
jgi:hypothetical protein